MSSSFIDIGEFGYWAHDRFVEAMQILLVYEIEESNLDKIEWVDEYKRNLALESVPMIYGGRSMRLEEFLINKDRKELILKLVDLIIEKIGYEETYFTGRSMHQRRRRAMTIVSMDHKKMFKGEKDLEETVNDSRWHESPGIIEVKDRYEHSFRLLKKLISGKLKTVASSPINYWNY